MCNASYTAYRTSFVIIALALTSACTFTPEPLQWVKENILSTPATTISQAIEPFPPPPIELTEDLLYQLLVGEIAGQRNRYDVAVAEYLALARTTRDPRIVNRATRIAIYARDEAAAQEAASLWAELEPNHPDPRQVLAIAAIREGRVEQAIEHLKVIFDFNRDKHSLEKKLWMIVNLINSERDADQVKLILRQFIAEHGDDAEILFAYAQVLMRLEEFVEARQVLVRVLEQRPNNQNAVMIYVSVLNRLGEHDQALQYLQKAITQSEEAFDLHIFYARVLIDLDNFKEAQKQFKLLAKQKPSNPDVLLSLGLLSLQLKQLDDAETYFTRLSEIHGFSNDSSFYLGKIAEEKNDHKRAHAWYSGVSGGQYHFNAQVRAGVLLGKQNQIDAGLAQLNKISTRTDKQQRVVIHAKASLLFVGERHDEAMQVYDEALQAGYDGYLLYARAMLAEKLDQLDVLEHDLQAIIAKEPDNAQALNALGYTLADRTDRHDEAFDLIQRALTISPNSHYILDSMGWILYRQGQLDKAIEFLQRSLSMQQDAEVAAHLGEVLWIKGDREAARTIWDTALEASPDHDILRSVIKRLNP